MDESTTIELGVQLAVSAGLVLVMTMLHSVGLVLISRLMPIGKDRLEGASFNLRSSWLLGRLGLLLFLLHIIEIWLFAAFYLAVETVQSLEEALDYSASAYVTLGRTVEYLPDDWRLVNAIEGLIGFVLISWSAAFMATTMNRLRR